MVITPEIGIGTENLCQPEIGTKMDSRQRGLVSRAARQTTRAYKNDAGLADKPPGPRG
jgi:hypothetical protein